MFNDWLGREGLYKSIVFIAAVFVGFLTTHMNVSAAPKAKQIDFWDDSEELTKLKINHAAWDALLKKHVIVDHPSGVNRFNYEAVTASDSAALDQYIEYLQRMEPRQYPKRCQKAYWLNLFNAGIVQQVLKSRSSIDSIKDLGGRLWKRKRFYIAMQKTSFDDIEHGILRPIFKDPRVHFSLAAGTIGWKRLPRLTSRICLSKTLANFSLIRAASHCRMKHWCCRPSSNGIALILVVTLMGLKNS